MITKLPLTLGTAEWHMPGPVGPPMRLPVDDVFLHHTATPVTAFPIKDALLVARIGIERFGRMSYSVLVHPGRVIFWAQLEHVGAHTLKHNSTSVGLALVGEYSHTVPPDTMVFDACYALWLLRSFGVVSRTPTVRPHRAVRSTDCPGSAAVDKVLPVLQAVAADPAWRP